MRINVAKARMFYMDDPVVTIDTDFDHEVFAMQKEMTASELAHSIEELRRERREFRKQKKEREASNKKEKINKKGTEI